MTAPKYYYNLNRCISDGKTQFDTTNMPKETYEVNGQIYYGSNDLMDLLNELYEENTMLKERRHEDINDLSVIAMKYKALEKENEQLKFENNELKCALALDEVEYIIAEGKKIDIPPYYEFEQRYDSVMHRREYYRYE